MISVEDARARILGALSATPAETVPLPAAWGRVLARPVLSRVTQPPADVSAMDGYAVRAADAAEGASLAVIGTAPAGHPFEGAVGTGQAVRIFTGGILPEGADSILLQEDAEASEGRSGSTKPSAPVAGYDRVASISRSARRYCQRGAG